MATYTTNYNLKKPALADKIRIADFNGNSDTIDGAMHDNAVLGAQLKSDIGIVENTNTATHNISAGQYVIWKGDLYTASDAISSGATLSNANLTAVSGGGLNALNSKFTTFTTGTTSIGSDYTTNITTNNVKYVKRSDGVVLVYGNFTIGTQISSSSAKPMFTGLPASANDRFPSWVMSEHYQDNTTRRLQMTATGNLNQIYTQFPIGDYEIIPFMYFAN